MHKQNVKNIQQLYWQTLSVDTLSTQTIHEYISSLSLLSTTTVYTVSFTSVSIACIIYQTYFISTVITIIIHTCIIRTHVSGFMHLEHFFLCSKTSQYNIVAIVATWHINCKKCCRSDHHNHVISFHLVLDQPGILSAKLMPS